MIFRQRCSLVEPWQFSTGFFCVPKAVSLFVSLHSYKMPRVFYKQEQKAGMVFCFPPFELPSHESMALPRSMKTTWTFELYCKPHSETQRLKQMVWLEHDGRKNRLRPSYTISHKSYTSSICFDLTLEAIPEERTSLLKPSRCTGVVRVQIK